jgi:hypothetical protein
VRHGRQCLSFGLRVKGRFEPTLTGGSYVVPGPRSGRRQANSAAPGPYVMNHSISGLVKSKRI